MRMHKINVSNAPRWADCVMGGNVIVSLQIYNCPHEEIEECHPKEIKIVLAREIQLPPVWKCKAGCREQFCSRDLSPTVARTNGDNFLFVSSLINVSTFCYNSRWTTKMIIVIIINIFYISYIFSLLWSLLPLQLLIIPSRWISVGLLVRLRRDPGELIRKESLARLPSLIITIAGSKSDHHDNHHHGIQVWLSS